MCGGWSAGVGCTSWARRRDELAELRVRRLPGVRRRAAEGLRRTAHPHPPAAARRAPAGRTPGQGFFFRLSRRRTATMNPIRKRRLWMILALVVAARSEEHTSELQSLMRISYALFCFQKPHYQLVSSINT